MKQKTDSQYVVLMGDGTQALYEYGRLVVAGEGGVNVFEVLEALYCPYEILMTAQNNLDWPVELEELKEGKDEEVYG